MCFDLLVWISGSLCHLLILGGLVLSICVAFEWLNLYCGIVGIVFVFFDPVGWSLWFSGLWLTADFGFGFIWFMVVRFVIGFVCVLGCLGFVPMELTCFGLSRYVLGVYNLCLFLDCMVVGVDRIWSSLYVGWGLDLCVY